MTYMSILSLKPKNIQNIPPVKVLWQTCEQPDGRKLFEQFKLNKGAIGDVFVNITKYHRGENNFIIEVKNAFNKKLGHELLSLENNKTKDITGFDIKVEDEYRRKSFRIGELLRLGSIMEMMENKSSHIKITSKNTAVYFHGKYKFEPDITAFNERDCVLKSIIKDTSPNFEDFNTRAQKLLQEAVETKDNAPNQRDLCTRTNALVKEYIERALLEEKPEKKHPFNYGFNMILRSKTVEQFKDFFNKIFENQGIDYKI